ncbi:unnamed protein product [Sphagnum jensenii]|uniref:Uncharacterized protein n=1 Tax=Sphagnum jensenii TaxID=128206 RepID=A0ABP0VEK7_9BRYO
MLDAVVIIRGWRMALCRATGWLCIGLDSVAKVMGVSNATQLFLRSLSKLQTKIANNTKDSASKHDSALLDSQPK